VEDASLPPRPRRHGAPADCSAGVEPQEVALWRHRGSRGGVAEAEPDRAG
jgi:hypothetical protein